ncbi:MAG: DUF1579 domain-containing protein [Planctomycetes bacterium]|nr:DUF1579 domain-containing protein [Planctomycetota bacterium]
MRTMLGLGAAVAVSVFLAHALARAQEKQDGAQNRSGEAAGEVSPEMKAAMAAMMPGPAHAKLGKLVGEWTTKSKLTVAGAPPEETEGKSKFLTVLGGRFLHEEHQGTMMGMPLQSARLVGYNNGSKKYEAVWTYTLGTSMMIMTGTSDDDGKTIKFDAVWDNEIGLRETIKIIYTFVDDDHFTITMGEGKMPDGSAGPEMEITYTRKK